MAASDQFLAAQTILDEHKQKLTNEEYISLCYVMKHGYECDVFINAYFTQHTIPRSQIPACYAQFADRRQISNTLASRKRILKHLVDVLMWLMVLFIAFLATVTLIHMYSTTECYFEAAQKCFKSHIESLGEPITEISNLSRVARLRHGILRQCVKKS